MFGSVITVDEVVPVGDQVPQGASFVTERDATIHAARRLVPDGLDGKDLLNLKPVPDPNRHGSVSG